MKLKLTLDNKPKHSDVVTGVAWSTSDTIFSLGDDHQLLMWNLAKNETSKVTDVSQELFPTGMQWPPKLNPGAGASTRKGTELLLVTAADGHFHLLGRGGRIEKSVQGHKGAVLCGLWNWEGSEILTSGEDGCVRIWSRAGMLRSTLAQCPEPIYACAWSPDSLAVVYAMGSTLVIKPTIPNSKTVQWKAHDGVILCVGWSPTSKLIISGSEDCRYKVWDSMGRSLFTSGLHNHPITCVSWAPGGDLFSVGSFNILRVCDRYGWSHCLEKLKTGSIYNMHWSADSTQFVCATASGHVFLASVIERTVSWGTYEANLKARRTIMVTEFSGNTEDRLDFRDRVIKMSMNYGFLVCVTTAQLYVYNVNNVNTPVVTELRENNSISLILQAPNNFILCGGMFVSVWSYEGKQVATIKWGGMRAEMMNKENATVSNDVIAFIDHADQKIIRVFDPSSGKPLSDIKMKMEIKQIALARDNYPGTTERQLAILDVNLDLYTIVIRKFGSPADPQRLTTMVSSIMWHNEAPMIAVIKDGRLRIYYFPLILYIDGALLDFTWEDRDLADLGRQPEILSYETNQISIRKPDGVLIVGTGSPFMAHLHSHATMGKFPEARRICRYVSSKLVWGVMAGLASWKQDLALAEICYSELQLYDKVLFVQDIKENGEDEPTRRALLAILSGNVQEAENILMQNGRIENAIELNVNCCNWDRALELATKNNLPLDLVLSSRKEYLEEINAKETNPLFIEMAKKHPSATKDRNKRTKKKKNSAGHEKHPHTPNFELEQKVEPLQEFGDGDGARSIQSLRTNNVPAALSPEVDIEPLQLEKKELDLEEEDFY